MKVLEPDGGLGGLKPNVHLKVSLSIIYYIGTWPPRGKYRRLYIVYTVFSFIFMLGVFLATEIANLLVNLGDVPRMLAGATLLMTNCTHACKVFVLLSRQARIQALLDATECPLFTRNNPEYVDTLRRYTRQGIVHHVAYQSLGLTAVLCWGISPLLGILAGDQKQLPTEGWYPYNWTASPAFEITSVHQELAIIVACFHNVAVDTLVTGLITVACCQFTILNESLARIEVGGRRVSCKRRQDAKDEIGPNWIKEPYQELKMCVRHSTVIFDFCREIEHVFGTVIFLQFLVNCIIICFIAFNISQMTVYVPSVLIGMTMYMCCMTYQIFIYCWHGNELHLHSEEIILAAYSNDWWCGTDSFKRGIQILMIRGQRPFAMAAGNIMLLSLHTFVKILRMSYSIFTVLQSSTES